ncbi:uncharacterized protein EV422DRAFT_137175 [Fimicolochytrium jonesii]|uniref:uncharacterized protein n=1 Tax=Fimicolochytrium jonesii TaxID=1396493 RepID=UPI0022FDBCC5|nr:uncharacterized protein EV422DRAFT_137175 [Fimicolochytrium jonesii]KAI8825692.1 hypothetical protein EV422DRAFT_137175 [Fimicolochytrium jonesii]
MVQDVTFFQSELRHKIALLNSEINKLNNEYDTINKENTNYMSFQRRYGIPAEHLWFALNRSLTTFTNKSGHASRRAPRAPRPAWRLQHPRRQTAHRLRSGGH